MDLMRIYRRLEEKVSQVDIGALWPGFHRLKFAVYDQSQCVLDGQYVEKTADFCANTAIEYGGEKVAIWMITGEEPDDATLAAKIIHEMFHGYQGERGECRWPDEMAALRSYTYSAENLSARLRENRLMAGLLEEFRAEDFARLLSLRAWRRRAFPMEYEYEAKVEQIEGSAEFVELRALAQLDGALAQRRWQRLAEAISSPDHLFPLRPACYGSGAAFLRLLAKNGTEGVFDFTNIPFAVSAVEGVEPAFGGGEPDEAVQALLEGFRAETGRIVEAALAKNDVALEGPCPLISVNVYNARRQGNYITSTYFVMLGEISQPNLLQGDFVVEMDGDAVRKVYRQ